MTSEKHRANYRIEPMTSSAVCQRFQFRAVDALLVTAHPLRYAWPRMNRTAAVLLLTFTVSLSGCATPDVKYSDLQPATTATVAGNTVTIHLGSDLMNSASNPRPKAQVKGATVYVVAYRSLREQSRELVVRLPAPPSGKPISVVWVDPDGRRVAVPLTK